jgi:hypothetical protein
MRIQALALPILLLAACARADTVLRIKMRLETTPPPEAETPNGGEMQLWVGDHRVREDTLGTPISVIRRFDRGKLYLIDHRAKTYAERDLPVRVDQAKLTAVQAKLDTMAGLGKESGRKATMTVTVTDEERRIGSWNARKVIVVRSDSLSDITAVKWMSTEVGVDEGMLQRWQEDAIVLPPGSVEPEVLESQRQLAAIPGYPVLEESRSRTVGLKEEKEFRWHKELVSAETKEPPAGLYDPPAGYKKVAFNQIDLTQTAKPEDR